MELIKPAYQQPIDKKTYNQTLSVFETLLKLLHPFMPFITEEIWHLINERKDGESIMIERIPEAGQFSEDIIERFENVKETITAIRNVRNENSIAQKDVLTLAIKGEYNNDFDACVKKMANLSEIKSTDIKIDGAVTFLIQSAEFYIELGDLIDVEEELIKMKEELDYYKGFLESVMKKLSNDRFVQNAPENVVLVEKQKKADADAKIIMLEERIRSLKKS